MIFDFDWGTELGRKAQGGTFWEIGFFGQIGSDDLGQARIGSEGRPTFPRLSEAIGTSARGYPRLSEVGGKKNPSPEFS